MDKLFGVNGLAGFLLAVVVLLGIVGFLGYKAVVVQRTAATDYYKIEDSKNIESHVQDASIYYKSVDKE